MFNRPVPMSDVQQGIWLSQQQLMDSSVYGVAEKIMLEGNLDTPCWLAAAHHVFSRTPALQMVVTALEASSQNLTPELKINPDSLLQPTFIDLSGAEDPTASLEQYLVEACQLPINLEETALSHAQLFKLNDESYCWFWRMHHLVIDGYGFSQLTQRVVREYLHRLDADPADASISTSEQEMEAACESYIEAQNAAHQLAVDQAAESGRYWQLQEPHHPIEPIAPARQSFKPRTYSVGIFNAPLDPARLALAAALTAATIQQKTDVVLGAHFLGRAVPLLKEVCTAQNEVPLRLTLDFDSTIEQNLDEVRSQWNQASKHQLYRHEKIRRDRKLSAEESLTELSLNLVPFRSTFTIGSLKARVYPVWTGPVEHLSLDVRVSSARQHFVAMMIPEGSLPDATARAYAKLFETVYSHLAQHSADDPLVLRDLPLGAENNMHPLPATASVEPFAHHENQSLISSNFLPYLRTSSPVLSDNNSTFTGHELSALISQYARYLLNLATSPQDAVITYLPRTHQGIIAPLAVLSSGLTLVPADATWPAERVQLIAEESKARFILTTRDLAQDLKSVGSVTVDSAGTHYVTPLIICVDDLATVTSISTMSRAALLPEELFRPIKPEDCAYILFTSGSTGRPKGVVVEHRNLSQYMNNVRCVYLPLIQSKSSLTTPLRCVHEYSFAFDSMFSPLTMCILGHHLYVPDEETLKIPAYHRAYIAQHDIQWIDTAPAILAELVKEGLQLERCAAVFVGGDRCSQEVWDILKAHPHLCAVNVYGPTENTVDAAYALVSETSTPSIGRALPGQVLFPVTPWGAQCPPLIPGELMISGASVARGYLNNQRETDEKFLTDPQLGRMYRTGDLVVARPEGNFDYLGRVDSQLSVNGVRIEPAEIEHALTGHPAIIQAVVTSQKSENRRRLVAHIVTDTPKGQKLQKSELRSYLAERLPTAFIPSVVVEIDALPLTERGKIDRKALTITGIDAQEGRPYHQLSTSEKTIANIFAEVLNLAPNAVTSESDVFSLGGHSLTAARIVGRLHEIGIKKAKLSDVFRDSRVCALACLEKAEPAQSPMKQETSSVTPAQQRLWFIERLHGPSPLYTIPLVLQPEEPLDSQALLEALQDVALNYPSLSSLYRSTVSGEVELVPLPEAEIRSQLNLEVVKYHDDLGQQMKHLDLTIDTAHQLPLRIFKAQAHGRQRILLVLHHLAADGWALAPFADALSVAYRAGLADRKAPLRTPPALPQPRAMTQADQTFWAHKLAGAPAVIELPCDRPRPNQRDYRGAETRVQLEPEILRGITQLANQTHSTTFMVLHTMVASLLSRCGAGEDIVLGTVYSGRSTTAEEQAVTFMANTLATRVHLDASRSLVDEVVQNRHSLIEALEHAHVPFDEVVSTLNPERHSAYHPLFQVLVVHQNTEPPVLRWGGGSEPLTTVGTGTAKFDLTFEFSTGSNSGAEPTLELRIEYATDIFDEETIQSMAQWFRNLLEQSLASPQSPLAAHPLAPEAREYALTAAETMMRTREEHARRPAPVAEAALNPSSWNTGRSMTDQLEYVLSAQPQRPAVIDYPAPGQRVVYCYQDLDRISAHIAYLLHSSGLQEGARVALFLPRSVHQITAIVATLRAGMTYVPIDPHYPLSRVRVILEDADVSAVLHADGAISEAVVEQLQHINDFHDVLALNLDQVDGSLATHFKPRPVATTVPAYIIFTSGSTGRPKGVTIPQSNVMRLISSGHPHFHYSADDTWTLFHSYAFDFSVWEIFGALLLGGSLVIVPHEVSRSPQELVELLDNEGVTVLNQTPSAFHQLVQAEEGALELSSKQQKVRLAQLRYLVLGGEAMNSSVVQRWYEAHPELKCQIINMYGITETTVHVTYYAVDAHCSSGSPVGHALEDLAVYLLDSQGNPVPPGVPGEIYVGGAGVAAGYMGRDDLNRQRFLSDPFARSILQREPELQEIMGQSSPIMYKSGDIAVRRHDGVLDFVGRSDRQVQLRGFRIELGEVEAAAIALEDVKDAFAQTVGHSASDQRLLLYVVGPSLESSDSLALRKELAVHLPPHMVPSAVVILKEFPLTVNGKLDIQSLPQPLQAAVSTKAPQTDLEKTIYRCFTKTLKIASCSIEDSFFDLGGHSMLAVELASALKQEGIYTRVGTIMSNPSISLLAEAVQRQQFEENMEDLQVLMPLQRSTSEGQGAIYCIHPAGGLSWCYSSLTKYVPASLPVWGLQARGVLAPTKQPVSLAEMAQSYIEHILRVHPGGPIHLVGWSLGGMVVQVMASELERSPYPLGAVVLLDAYPSEGERGVGEPPLEDAVSAVLAMAGLEDSALNGPATKQGLIEALSAFDSPMAGLPSQTIEALCDTYRNTAKILREFNHQSTTQDVLFFRATRAGVGKDHLPDEWRPYLSGALTVVDVDCTHREMNQGGPMSVIGPRIMHEIETVSQRYKK